jgi:DNA (cytosine-5)-methyltransferase 1
MPIKADNSLRAYYNEIDPFAAAQLRELMHAGWITKGDVDERSIEDVVPNDLNGYDRIHFFAGFGVWDYCLNQVLWGKSRVWTGSCPCQPFSAAGKGAGFTDERHLWPAFFHLIDQCRPLTVFGEQVASKHGLAWFDLVQADMEGAGYACGAVDSCAAGFGAPHIRQRLYWVAYTKSGRWGKKQPNPEGQGGFVDNGAHDRLDNTIGTRLERLAWDGDKTNVRQKPSGSTPTSGTSCRLGDSISHGFGAGRDHNGEHDRGQLGAVCNAGFKSTTGPTNGFWRDADWLFCRDGKWRTVVATHVTLADGPSSGMVRMCHESAIKKKEEISNERLCALRQGTGSETFFQWSSGVSIHVGAPEVLQQNMYGTTHEERDMFQSEPQQDEGGQDGGECLRDMWNDERSASSSCGQKSAKQCAIELEDVVSLLPCSLSLAKLYGDWRTEESLRLLQQAIYEAGALLYPSQPIQKVWASLSEEEKNSVRMGFDASRWKKLVSSPLECGATNRVGRLRGYGNAIVAPQAEEFIRAYMEITNYF